MRTVLLIAGTLVSLGCAHRSNRFPGPGPMPPDPPSATVSVQDVSPANPADPMNPAKVTAKPEPPAPVREAAPAAVEEDEVPPGDLAPGEHEPVEKRYEIP